MTAPKTRWWKPNEEENCVKFKDKVKRYLKGKEDWKTAYTFQKDATKMVLGMTSDRKKKNKETWWWSTEMQDSIRQ